ncbi:MAG: hypothetical protein V3V00_03935 [Saprospiraceae bacterium]
MIKEDKKHIYHIAIDEFQVIAEYESTNIDASLREALQIIPNLHFLFCGSQNHLLQALFNDTKKPLFRTTEMMELHAIPYPAYMAFIQQQFAKNDKMIDEKYAHEILEWTKNHTHYVQYFCHMLFENSGGKVENYHMDLTKLNIYNEHENVYYQFKRLVTRPQWKVLCAIAHENIMRQPMSSKINEKYRLGAASTTGRSLETLLDKEMLYSKINTKGEMEYHVYDVFLMRWIQHKGFQLFN